MKTIEIIATECGVKNSMSRKRNPSSRRRNAGLDWFKTRKGAITLGGIAGAAVGLGLWVFNRRSYQQEAELFLEQQRRSMLLDDEGNIVETGGTGAIGTTPKPIPKKSLPAEILAGGVPLGEGWKTVGWYTYPEGQKWIRIDEYGDALFKEGETTFTQHTGKIIGRWRWVVVEGSTWIAKGELDGTYDLARNVIYNKYDRESAEETMYWAAAMQAMRWIDTAYGLK